MKNLTLKTIPNVTGGILRAPSAEAFAAVEAAEICAVCTDSRAAAPGCLFAAIRGARADGHDFVAETLKKGALCALVERPVPGAAGCVIQVKDTVTALQRLAEFYRSGFPALPLLGITGSVGKTTAKEMTAAVLSRRFCVHKTAGNFNNDLGVPLTLFGLREEHSAAVVELGVSHPGDMARLAHMARPTMALLTNIGDAHLEFLGSRAGILREKATVCDALPADGTVFCNGDDPLLRELNCARRVVTFGLGAGCDVRAEDVHTLPDGTTECAILSGAARIPVRISAYGEHMVYAALAAAAVGQALGLTPAEIAEGIADYVPVGRRARLLHTGTLTVIDDCYNANPTSVASALRSLSRWTGRRVCILGDMLELGVAAEALHRETGALAARCAELVLTTGALAAQIAAGAGTKAHHFENRDALLSALPTLLCPGDTVLVKASRSAHFEEITAALETL
ncbi:MAG: UDP-N-acetylmuramoyl-tripeptide--D-alanyl-D-alanine ligase [Oscillospiraceae bacterium]|nr:UDP-N-acetylmuramoyl-tripeptide--D-alanyl-D-alanine ligase [Oscillospiraceae bacterium]